MCNIVLHTHTRYQLISKYFGENYVTLLLMFAKL